MVWEFFRQLTNDAPIDSSGDDRRRGTTTRPQRESPDEPADPVTSGLLGRRLIGQAILADLNLVACTQLDGVNALTIDVGCRW